MIQDIGLLVLRVAFGATLAGMHGLSKMANYSALVAGGQFPNPLGVGSTVSVILTIFAEVVCGLFVVIGAATRFAAGIVAFTMLVAFIVVHGGQPFSQRELAFTYFVPFFVLTLTGPGRFSLDSVFGWFKK